jgi:hypothetical protein
MCTLEGVGMRLNQIRPARAGIICVDEGSFRPAERNKMGANILEMKEAVMMMVNKDAHVGNTP